MAEATALFLRDGFERTSIDRIAAGAHVSKQAIYALFQDKVDLFAKVVRACLSQQTVDTLPQPEGSVRHVLETHAIRQFDAYADPDHFGLFRAQVVLARSFPALASELHEFRRRSGRSLVNYLQNLIDEGLIPPSFSNATDLSTRLGGTTAEGSRFLLGNTLLTPAQRTEQVRLTVSLFLGGLRQLPTGEATEAPLPYALEPPQLTGTTSMRLKPERFDMLCAAAAREFLDQGYETASLDRILAATGIGRSTVYRQFGDKLNLFRYVLHREIDAQWCELGTGPDTSAGPEERLRRLCRDALDLHLDARSVAMHHLLIQDCSIVPDLARRFYAMQVERLRQPFTRLLAEAGLPPPAPATLRACHTLATFGMRYIASPRAIDEEERRTESAIAARILWRGVDADGG
ncbi:TetR/AcrR family transcriptional regulator [Sphingobium estronivorans]|uniref:TetR/AcrR family transcriptional regulator n=1 Tax=Sphingobium estronivorans TaxID=1577690 RepID=UPI0013C310EF|nr:TetR/AcrR family transcriptional regulator [Sphingobium estronivorans]